MRKGILLGMCALLFSPTFALAGSQTFSTPGSHSFTVPSYISSLTVKVWGGGGGGGGNNNGTAYPRNSGSAGGTSAFGTGPGGTALLFGYGGSASNQMYEGGGLGGAGGSYYGGTGTAGSSGGDGAILTTPSSSVCRNGGTGGSSSSGGSGGTSVQGCYSTGASGGSGSTPGGGGSGGVTTYAEAYEDSTLYTALGFGGGGGGGYTTKTYSVGELTPGASLGITVGAGGAGGSGTAAGGSGADGRVEITWDTELACSVSADVNPLPYGNTTTLRWESANATTFYINNVGYVTPNESGSATVGPVATTNYDGAVASGGGQAAGCLYTLTVNGASDCTFQGQTVAHGASVTAYQAPAVASGGCASESRTCNNGTLSGTYQYSSCIVGPQCTLEVDPESIVQGSSAALSWDSSNADVCTGTNFSTGAAPSGLLSVSPLSDTSYSAVCLNTSGLESPNAYWKFDEASGDAIDETGNGNTGTLENGATRYSESSFDSALELDGVNDRIFVTPTNLNALPAFSISAWVRPTKYSGTIVLKKNTAPSYINFGISSDGTLYVRAGHTVTTGAWRSTGTVPLNAWSHVAVTYSFGGTPVFYIDGLASGLTLVTEPAGSATSDDAYLYLGSNVAMTAPFGGRIDHLRIHPSVLSAAEIEGEYGTDMREAQCNAGEDVVLDVQCTPSYSCNGSTIVYTDAECVATEQTTCVSPEFCSAGSSVCVLPVPTVDILNASPRLVFNGRTSTISWETTNTDSCTVTGNGNTWTGVSGSETSNPITEYTTYSLACDDLDVDTVEDDVEDSISIIMIPFWREL